MLLSRVGSLASIHQFQKCHQVRVLTSQMKRSLQLGNGSSPVCKSMSKAKQLDEASLHTLVSRCS